MRSSNGGMAGSLSLFPGSMSLACSLSLSEKIETLASNSVLATRDLIRTQVKPPYRILKSSEPALCIQLLLDHLKDRS